jgi:hypothetical protein
MRMLATLLEGEAGDIEPKVALEMLKRRPKAVAPLMARPVTLDGAKLARVRSDIRALVAPSE